MRGHIEILPLVSTRGPDGVVVVAQSQVQSKGPGDLPIILEVEIPIGIAVTNKTGVSDFLQNENVVIFQGRNDAGSRHVVIGLLRAQPLIIPVDANLRAEM